METKEKSAEQQPPPQSLNKNVDGNGVLASPADGGKSSAEGEGERVGFGNGFEFIITCLGLAVGLGNIWRFPTRAYANGGSAFLIPYLTFAFLFGLPAIYIEFVAGQYNAKSPPVIYRRIMPLLEGVGWMSSVVATLVAVYYIVIISWICIYMSTVWFHSSKWIRCDNPWNDISTCIDSFQQKQCFNGTSTEKYVFINGRCRNNTGLIVQSATEQYFNNFVLKPSKGLLDVNRMNWPIFFGMTFCWILTGLLIVKGPKIMGKISYGTVLLPYFLVTVLAIRGVFLEGASEGLYYYFGKPDYSKLADSTTWVEALKQLCFSLSVGHGGLMNMASYSEKRHNCFRDALIVVLGDTVMSLMGGTAVFSVLGFLAHHRGVTVPEVVQSGTAIAFVVYPEAMTQVPGTTIITFVFFLMLFLLAISTEIALTEVVCSCIYDQFPKLRRQNVLVVSGWCILLYLVGIVFSTDAGLYWFEVYDEYAAGFSSVCTVVAEVVVLVWVYGWKNLKNDMVDMMGPASNAIFALIGPHSPYFIGNWMVITPAIGLILVGFAFKRDYPYNHDAIKYPPFFDIFGWFLSICPLLMIPAFILRNYLNFKKYGVPMTSLLKLQKQHPSYPRISLTFTDAQKEMDDGSLPDKEPWDEDNDGLDTKDVKPAQAV